MSQQNFIKYRKRVAEQITWSPARDRNTNRKASRLQTTHSAGGKQSRTCYIHNLLLHIFHRMILVDIFLALSPHSSWTKLLISRQRSYEDLVAYRLSHWMGLRLFRGDAVWTTTSYGWRGCKDYQLNAWEVFTNGLNSNFIVEEVRWCFCACDSYITWLISLSQKACFKHATRMRRLHRY